jgi:8-oxo-dGTP pyrophosphatase MutT (NUDIX family)
MISGGNETVIKEINDFSFENIKISFIDENSLPDTSKVSAVFLVGFVENKIIAARNERGWDIPGGHIESTDSSLTDSLKREVDEESGTVVGEIKPYAIVQFEGKEKVMLFYASKDCQLVDFIPKEDALERELMTIPIFISKYNWRKDVMELLIKRALLVLSLN